MQTKVNRKELVEAVGQAVRLMAKRTSIPILSHVQIVANGELIVVATDCEVSSTIELKDWETQDYGTVTLPARRLLDLLKGTQGETVTLKSGENYQLALTSGSASYSMYGMDPNDFPSVPRLLDGAQVSTAEVKDMLELTTFCMSRDETRLNLNGVYLEASGKVMRLTSTDGHRLATVARSSPVELPSAILPDDFVLELQRLVGKKGAPEFMRLGVAKQKDSALAVAQVGNVILTCKVIDGMFPDYKQVLPAKFGICVTAGTVYLKSCIEEMLPVSKDGKRGVKLELHRTGGIVMSSNDPNMGHAESRVACEIEWATPTADGDEMEEQFWPWFKSLDLTWVIGFDGKYLLDALRHTGERVSIGFQAKQEVHPCVMMSDAAPGWAYIVMPMRL